MAALRPALSVLLRLLAPFLPFVTEEVWSWWRQNGGPWQTAESVHRAAWPEPEGLRAAAGSADGSLLDAASAAIGAVRKAKSEGRLPMRAEVRRLVVTGPEPDLAALAAVLADVRAAGVVAETELRPVSDTEPEYQITF